MIHCVEILLDIEIYHPFISFIQILQYFFDRSMAVSSSSEPVTVFTVRRFIDPVQLLCDHLLYDSVSDCRYAERSFLSVGFRDIDPSYRLRLIFHFHNWGFDLLFMFFEISVNFIHRHLIDSRCAFITFDPSDCLIEVFFTQYLLNQFHSLLLLLLVKCSEISQFLSPSGITTPCFQAIPLFGLSEPCA